jgi:hypothetical protein
VEAEDLLYVVNVVDLIVIYMVVRNNLPVAGVEKQARL